MAGPLEAGSCRSRPLCPPRRADLFALLERLGIETRDLSSMSPVFTVAESQAIKQEIPGGHTKNLFLKDKKGRIFLVVAEPNAAIDLKRLHRRIGASGRLSFGSAELLRLSPRRRARLGDAVRRSSTTASGG